MSNPFVQPRETINAPSNVGPNGAVPDSDIFKHFMIDEVLLKSGELKPLRYPYDRVQEMLAEAKRPPHSIEVQQEFVDSKNMEKRKSFLVPGDYVSTRILERQGWDPRRPASAYSGGLNPRPRSVYAKRVMAAGWDRLPAGGDVFYGALNVRLKMENTALVSGGTEHTLGRLRAYYPNSIRTGAVYRPPTGQEVSEALRSCGLLEIAARSGTPDAIRVLSLSPAPGEEGVKVNPKASNGFPNQGTWEYEPDRLRVLQMANEMDLLVTQAHRKDADKGVWDLIDDLMETRPYMVAVQGKCKADYYSYEKIVEQKLRFYNVLPRQFTLLMQRVTQQLERYSSHMLEDASRHTAQGVGLVRGNAHRLVLALETQLSYTRFSGRSIAYAHVGDDSWVAVLDGTRLHMFALDCSSFDLTQHSAVTGPVHRALRDLLLKVEGGGAYAQLWYKYMRERLTVVTGTATVVMRHGGPSGTPLQSKVNDVLMDILLQRLTVAVDRAPTLDADTLDTLVASVGAEMGFSVRLEQYGVSAAPDPTCAIRTALRERPFLFIGYYFHVMEERSTVVVDLPDLVGSRVVPFCDLPRTLAQLRYPSIKWTAEKDEFRIMEAARLAATVANMGIPPVPVVPAYEAMRAEVLDQLGEVISQLGARADAPMRQLGFVTGDPTAAVGGPAVSESSLRGLYRYLDERRNEAVWGYTPDLTAVDEQALMAEVDAILGTPAEARPIIAVSQSAAEVDGEEVVQAPPLPSAGFLTIRRPNGQTVTIATPRAGVRPLTDRNFGRPPPTSQVTNEVLLAGKKREWAERDAKRAAARADQGGRSRAEATTDNADYQAHKSRGRRNRKHRKH